MSKSKKLLLAPIPIKESKLRKGHQPRLNGAGPMADKRTKRLKTRQTKTTQDLEGE